MLAHRSPPSRGRTVNVAHPGDVTWTPISPTIDNGAFQLPTTHTHRYFRFTN